MVIFFIKKPDFLFEFHFFVIVHNVRVYNQLRDKALPYLVTQTSDVQ